MAKIIIYLVSVLSLLMLGACAGNDDSPKRGPKPRRDAQSGTLPWARPADWEGGLPGMSGGVGSQNNNY